MAQTGQRFTLSLDGWISTKDKRCMCVNLHLNESKSNFSGNEINQWVDEG